MVDEHTIDVLEFDKVIQRIAGFSASPMGREEVLKMVPITDLGRISSRMGSVGEMIDLIGFDDPFPSREVPDIRKTLVRCGTEGVVLSAEALSEIGSSLIVFRQINDYLERRSEKYPVLFGLAERLTSYPEVEAAIGRAIGPEGEILDSASPELGRIRRDRERLRSELREKLERILAELPSEVVQERLVTLREGRFVIPLREGRQKRVPGIIHDLSASGATVFVEPLATMEIGNKIRQFDLAEAREIERILRALTERVRSIRDDLKEGLEAFGRLDAIYAAGAFSREIEAQPAPVKEGGEIVLKGARHPLLVLRAQDSDPAQEVIPLDISLGRDFLMLVLTGPNAGGKTVALKTVGLLTLMACSGLPIPAQRGTEISIFQGIFADIGDEQSIENDLSTFSSHVRRLSHICRQADRETLVLLDEVGGSTDPDEGAALAMALLKELVQRGAKTVATTHHGALKAFAHQTPSVENGSMEFDTQTLRPTFRLRLSIPGSSYAFEIARRWGMPESIVDAASRLMGGDARQVERLIADLDQSSKVYREGNEKLALQENEVERLRRIYEENLEDLEKKRKDLKRTALQESERILNQANTLIERTVADIRREAASRDSIRQARREVQEGLSLVREEIEGDQPEEFPEGMEVKGGDRVWIERFGKEGVVLPGKHAGGRIRVHVGNVKVEVSQSEVRKAAGGPAPKQDRRLGSMPVSGGAEPSTTLDLRGMTFEEAADVVDKYLDDAFVARIERATVIHGKGTGALRQKVGKYLKSHPRIRSQRLGEWNEGGSGVTVVELELGG